METPDFWNGVLWGACIGGLTVIIDGLRVRTSEPQAFIGLVGAGLGLIVGGGAVVMLVRLALF